jgi:hypothetical protein
MYLCYQVIQGLLRLRIRFLSNYRTPRQIDIITCVIFLLTNQETHFSMRINSKTLLYIHMPTISCVTYTLSVISILPSV